MHEEEFHLEAAQPASTCGINIFPTFRKLLLFKNSSLHCGELMKNSTEKVMRALECGLCKNNHNGLLLAFLLLLFANPFCCFN